MKKIFLLLCAALLCLTADAQSWKRIRGNTAADKAFTNITGTGTYGRTFNIPVGKYYLFSLELTSPHEVYFTFKPVANGSKKICYTTPGKKQKLVEIGRASCRERV